MIESANLLGFYLGYCHFTRAHAAAFEEMIMPDEIHALLRWSDWVPRLLRHWRILRPQIDSLRRITAFRGLPETAVSANSLSPRILVLTDLGKLS